MLCEGGFEGGLEVKGKRVEGANIETRLPRSETWRGNHMCNTKQG